MVNFKSKAAYRKWLAFGHIHHKFHGEEPIKIHGHAHHVKHISIRHHERFPKLDKRLKRMAKRGL